MSRDQLIRRFWITIAIAILTGLFSFLDWSQLWRIIWFAEGGFALCLAIGFQERLKRGGPWKT